MKTKPSTKKEMKDIKQRTIYLKPGQMKKKMLVKKNDARNNGSLKEGQQEKKKVYENIKLEFNKTMLQMNDASENNSKTNNNKYESISLKTISIE